MGEKYCGFEGCERNYYLKGLCRSHYKQLAKGAELRPIRATGRPPGSKHGTIEEFFWARVNRGEGCWAWTGKKSILGYGQIKYEGRTIQAHRFSYELHVEPIREGGVIDHLCHNANCVNPDHLRVASHSQNMQNLNGLQANNTSGARGVYWSKQAKRWRVSVQANGIRAVGKNYLLLEDAAREAEELRRRLHI